MSAHEVAAAFVPHYYNLRDTNPDALMSLYQPQSSMTSEGNMVTGNAAIVENLKKVGPVKHTIKNHDVQPSTSNNAMLIFVVGSVVIGDSGNPIHFCQLFQLVSMGPGQFYIHNDMFRLNYGL